MNKQPYDLTAIYNQEIWPLIGRIRDVCEEHNLPFAATFQIAFDKDGAVFATSATIDSDHRPIGKMLGMIADILETTIEQQRPTAKA